MRLARLATETADGIEPRIVVASELEPDVWVDVRTAERGRLVAQGATQVGAGRLAAALVPGSLSAALEAGPSFLQAARAAAETADYEAAGAPLGARVLAPIDPIAYRDFMAFEAHFVKGSELRGVEPADVLYEFPVSYFGNAAAVLGPEDEIPWPHYTDQMDYELELGIVIGRGGRDIAPEDALEHVLGLTVFNDFSARDIQLREMSGGLGPSKAKHFASSVGPCIVTLEGLGEDLAMSARVNGELWSQGSSGTIMWSIGELVAWASAAEPLAAGTLLGSGTVGGGCGFELGRSLSRGDVVELEIEGIGILRNRLAAVAATGWTPARKRP